MRAITTTHILDSSEEQKREHKFFQIQLNDLRTFEQSLTSFRAKFSQVLLDYEMNSHLFAFDVNGKRYPIGKKTIPDIMGKSGSPFTGSAKTFEDLRGMPTQNENDYPMDYHYFAHHFDKSKREVKGFADETHKFIVEEDEFNPELETVVGVKTPKFPLHDFHYSEFIPAFLEVAEEYGKKVSKPILRFNRDTGNVFGMLLFDTFTVNSVDINDKVDYGIVFGNGKLGGKGFFMKICTNLQACSNGLHWADETLFDIYFKNTSSENYWRHLYENFLQKTYGNFDSYRENKNLSAIEKTILYKLAKRQDINFDNDEYTKWTFYKLLAKAIISTTKSHMNKIKFDMELAGQTLIDPNEMTRAINRLWDYTPYGKTLSKDDKENAHELWVKDTTLNRRNPTVLDLSNIITRLANGYTKEKDQPKREALQEIGVKIIQNPLTLGIPTA